MSLPFREWPGPTATRPRNNHWRHPAFPGTLHALRRLSELLSAQICSCAIGTDAYCPYSSKINLTSTVIYKSLCSESLTKLVIGHHESFANYSLHLHGALVSARVFMNAAGINFPLWFKRQVKPRADKFPHTGVIPIRLEDEDVRLRGIFKRHSRYGYMKTFTPESC